MRAVRAEKEVPADRSRDVRSQTDTAHGDGFDKRAVPVVGKEIDNLRGGRDLCNVGERPLRGQAATVAPVCRDDVSVSVRAAHMILETCGGRGADCRAVTRHLVICQRLHILHRALDAECVAVVKLAPRGGAGIVRAANAALLRPVL